MKLKNEDILYEDKEIIVCRKQAGTAVQTSRPGEADMESLLRNYLKTSYVGIIHRLDQPVEGILAFAKTKRAAAELSAQSRGQAMVKNYYAVAVSGKAESGSGGAGRQPGMEYALTDYLLKNGRDNISGVAAKGTPGAKKAELVYKILETKQTEENTCLFLMEITLKTGRHHQIRVQLANAGLPLLGDAKYGMAMRNGRETAKEVALCACRLEFSHPVTGERLHFEIQPSGGAFREFFGSV